VNTSGQKFLRGYQITDSNGQVQFTTIYPGWYSGRTIHIHVRVRTYSGATVLGNFMSQIFFDDAINNAVMAQSAYSRTTPRDTTNPTDMIYNVENQTRMLASVTGSLASGYTAAITFGVSLAAPSAVAPSVSPGGVANAISGSAGMSPNTWISIYGSNFSTTVQTLTSTDIVNSTIPAALNGVSVQINGKPAYVEYVSPGQINALAPADSSVGTVGITVTNSAGTSPGVTATMAAVLPGLAVLSNYVRAIRYPDLVLINGTGSSEAGFKTAAEATPGDVIALFGTGFGPTDPSVEPGQVFTGAYPATNKVTVTIGGVAAQVLWAGLAAAGLHQINVVVPSNIASGDHAVVASVAGSNSQSGAPLKISAAAAQLGENSSAAVVATSRILDPTIIARASRIEDLIRLGGLWRPEHRAGAPRG
jgi:uncharacterized protein (TIGR03437 family)